MSSEVSDLRRMADERANKPVPIQVVNKVSSKKTNPFTSNDDIKIENHGKSAAEIAALAQKDFA